MGVARRGWVAEAARFIARCRAAHRVAPRVRPQPTARQDDVHVVAERGQRAEPVGSSGIPTTAAGL